MSRSKVSFQDEDGQKSSTVLVYHDICLKRSDVQLLLGPFWLNDQIIAFYFQYLESNKFASASNRLLFVSPPVTQLLKMSSTENAEDDCHVFLDPLRPDDKEILFFPVNDNATSRAGGTHWSLLVYSRNEDAFFSFDSMDDSNIVATRKLIRNLKLCLGCRSADFHNINCAQQLNGYDCGIHLIVNAENICNHFLREGIVRHVPSIDSITVANKRRAIMELIQELGGKVST